MPDGWAFARINSLFFIQTGASFKKEQATSDFTQTRILRGGNILQGEYRFFENDIFVDSKLIQDSIILKNNDLITPAVTSIENIGKLARIEKDYEDVTAGGFVFIVRPCYNSDIFAKYMLYALQSSYFNKQLKSITKKSGQAFYNLGKERFIQLIIPIPPLNEQVRIVESIEQFTPLIKEYDKLEQQATKLDGEIYDKLKKSILPYAIQGKLVPQDSNDEPAAILLERIRAEKKAQLGKKYVESYIYKGDDNCYYEHINGKDVDITEEIPYDLPIGWIWERLRNITEIIGDGIHGTPNFDDNGKYYFINGNNLVGGKIVLKDSTKKVNENEFLLHRKPLTLNTILLSINGTLGNIAYYNNEPIILGKSACYISLSKDISKEYVRVVLETKSFLDYAVHRATKTTIANISLNAIRTFLFPVPPLAEQKRIVEKIDEIFAKL